MAEKSCLFFSAYHLSFSQIDQTLLRAFNQKIYRGNGAGRPAVFKTVMSGCPMAVPNWKLSWIIETSGAVIVGEESCVGERSTRNLTDDSGITVDELMEAIIDRYF